MRSKNQAMIFPTAKKKGALFGGAFLVAGLLVACTPAAASVSSSESVTSTYVPYDVSVYGDPKDLTASFDFWTTTGKQNEDALAAVAAAFNVEYPNIQINVLPQGGYPDIQTKLNNAIPAGTTPTVAYCYPDHVANYLGSGAVADLQGFVTDPTIGYLEANADIEGKHTSGAVTLFGADDYVSGYWNEGKAYQKSGLYSVPFTKSTEALYYNKTVFDAKGWTVPSTWDEMWALCATIKDTNPDYTPLGYDSDSNLFISGLASLGIPYTSSTGAHYLFNNDQAKSLVQTWIDKYHAGEFVTKGLLPNNAYTSTDFTEQKILMIVSSTGGTSYADTSNFEVGVAPVPHYVGHDLQVISQGPSLCFFRRADWRQKYAAWLFYRFCTRAEVSARFAVASTGYDPVRVSSYSTPFYLDYLSSNSGNLYGRTAAVTASLRDDIFFSPVFEGSSNARTEVGKILSLIIQNGMTVDAAFKQAYDSCVTAGS